MDQQQYISLVTELRHIAEVRSLSILGERDVAADVGSEVLLRIWERLPLLNNHADELKSYADRMAKNLSLNILRHRRRHPLLRMMQRTDDAGENDDGIPDIPSQYTPLKYVEDKETGHIVVKAMEQLPYSWRKIVEMREQEGMSYAEIATLLGTSESSCRGIMSKARQRLVQLINKMI